MSVKKSLRSVTFQQKTFKSRQRGPKGLEMSESRRITVNESEGCQQSLVSTCISSQTFGPSPPFIKIMELTGGKLESTMKCRIFETFKWTSKPIKVGRMSSYIRPSLKTVSSSLTFPFLFLSFICFIRTRTVWVSFVFSSLTKSRESKKTKWLQQTSQSTSFVLFEIRRLQRM